ncbi:hypothetical protein [Granulicella arctica]|uniref:hypothetical protein n=1 Tax=Granulicella arctica TaxID=940613 RepID=UPI0021E0CDBF|nr:hypothetical protein [Granulicella arctica]
MVDLPIRHRFENCYADDAWTIKSGLKAAAPKTLLYPQAPRKWEVEPFLMTAIALRIAITVTVAVHHAGTSPATCVSCQNELHVRPRVIAVFARLALGIL